MSQLTWQKSSFSEAGADTCVEIAVGLAGRTHLRESDDPGTVLTTSPTALRTLVRSIKAGAVGVTRVVCAPDGPPLL